MKIRISELRKIIREALRGSHPEESYDIELMDDPALDKPSVYVPDEVKDKIKSWAKDMHLSSK